MKFLASFAILRPLLTQYETNKFEIFLEYTCHWEEKQNLMKEKSGHYIQVVS